MRHQIVARRLASPMVWGYLSQVYACGLAGPASRGYPRITAPTLVLTGAKDPSRTADQRPHPRRPPPERLGSRRP